GSARGESEVRFRRARGRGRRRRVRPGARRWPQARTTPRRRPCRRGLAPEAIARSSYVAILRLLPRADHLGADARIGPGPTCGPLRSREPKTMGKPFGALSARASFAAHAAA